MRKVISTIRSAGLAALIVTNASLAFAKDAILVIGGGPEPSSNQLSIEQNVEFMGQTLERLGIEPKVVTKLFASGAGETPDVCFRHDGPIALASELLTPTKDGKRLTLDYRHHRIPAVAGAATRRSMLRQLRAVARASRPGDRVLVYFTGHGGKGTPIDNGHFHTWQGEKLDVKTLAGALDVFPPETTVLVVMVQCYSGSFANLIYRGGDPSKGLAPHRRAGYFATVASRPAAGCTPDTRKENYEEYSTYFWAALGGRDRAGAPVQATDIDGDGVISVAEAHAHTVVHAPTIDLPNAASEAFLRRHASATGGSREKAPADSPGTEEKNGQPSESAAPGDQLAWDAPYSRLLESADKLDRFILEELSRRLDLSGETRLADAARAADQIAKEREAGQAETAKLEKSRDEHAASLVRSLSKRWPVLKTAWHPRALELLVERRAEVEAWIQSAPRYEAWKADRDRIEVLRGADLVKERRWALLERFVRAGENVALAHNLALAADPAIVGRYVTLRQIEAMRLVEPAVPAGQLGAATD